MERFYKRKELEPDSANRIQTIAEFFRRWWRPENIIVTHWFIDF
jgi:hypothetical protein